MQKSSLMKAGSKLSETRAVVISCRITSTQVFSLPPTTALSGLQGHLHFETWGQYYKFKFKSKLPLAQAVSGGGIIKLHMHVLCSVLCSAGWECVLHSVSDSQEPSSEENGFHSGPERPSASTVSPQSSSLSLRDHHQLPCIIFPLRMLRLVAQAAMRAQLLESMAASLLMSSSVERMMQSPWIRNSLPTAVKLPGSQPCWAPTVNGRRPWLCSGLSLSTSVLHYAIQELGLQTLQFAILFCRDLI